MHYIITNIRITNKPELNQKCKDYELYKILGTGEQSSTFFGKSNKGAPKSCKSGIDSTKLNLDCDEGHLLKYILSGFLKIKPLEAKEELELKEIKNSITTITNTFERIIKECNFAEPNKSTKQYISTSSSTNNAVFIDTNSSSSDVGDAGIFILVIIIFIVVCIAYAYVAEKIEESKNKNSIEAVAQMMITEYGKLNSNQKVVFETMIYDINYTFASLSKKLNNFESIKKMNICVCNNETPCSKSIHKFKKAITRLASADLSYVTDNINKSNASPATKETLTKNIGLIKNISDASKNDPAI